MKRFFQLFQLLGIIPLQSANDREKFKRTLQSQGVNTQVPSSYSDGLVLADLYKAPDNGRV